MSSASPAEPAFISPPPPELPALESLGADDGHAEHRVERAVDVRHELLLLVPEQRAQHTQHATRVRNTRALSCTIHTSIQYENTTKEEYECNTSVTKVKVNNLLYSNRKINALLNTKHNANYL